MCPRVCVPWGCVPGVGSVCPRGCPWGVCVLGVCPRRWRVLGGVSQEQTDRCKKHYVPLRLRSHEFYIKLKKFT